ncbi:MAG: NHL repeat-containing protein, partial [Thermodesulfobacteriota bacterium]|nr:NHL repeat-containing protein [Thermodesulfobacteriota bacterium]
MKKACAVILTFILLLLPQAGYTYQVLPLRHLFDITHSFLQPTDVAVGKDNAIYVVDGVNNSIKVFNQEGDYRFSFGGKGTTQGRFDTPVSVTVDSTGTVYVADTGNRRAQVFTSDGKVKDQITLPVENVKNSRDPVGVAIDESVKRLYVSDNDNHQILVYSLPDYKLLTVWGSEGSGMKQFRYPFLMDASNDGAVFIVDVFNTRVQQWRGDSGHKSIGEWGVDLGQLYRPKGVCVDKNGLVFVSDSVLGVIQVFDSGGNFKAVLGTEKGGV